MQTDPSSERDHRPTQMLWLACKLVVVLAVLNGLLLSVKAPMTLLLFLSVLVVSAGLFSYARIVLVTKQQRRDVAREKDGAVAWR